MDKHQFMDKKCLSRTSGNNDFTVFILNYSDIYHAKKMLKNFEEFIDNLFRPLFEVSLDPESHPELHQFLKQVRMARSEGLDEAC